jgi:dimeric dUTPase (all-alpha-NTP-PPase superfamily)
MQETNKLQSYVSERNIIMDNLQHMLNMQQFFQERLGADFTTMTTEESTAFIKEHSIHLNQEINEMLYELPFFKPWKDYSAMSEEEIVEAINKARVECVDAWHFFMNIMLGLGLDADEFYRLYLAKNSENHRRQDEGYDADTSYKDQQPDEIDIPLCKITMDGESLYSSDFVAVIARPEGGSSVLFNTDPASLGVCIRMLAKEYYRMLDDLSDNERIDVENYVHITANALLNDEEAEPVE